MHRYLSLSRFLSLLACVLSWIAVNETRASGQPPVPSLTAAVTGPKQLVFDTKNGCDGSDIPDAPARAFRDFKDVVHLVAAHYSARAMTGRDMEHLKRDCRVVYRSPQDPEPSHFQYNSWLYSFYTTDGHHIAALMHSEFDGEKVHGLCDASNNTSNCWANTVTFAQSLDGGYNFSVPAPPKNLVAAAPYRALGTRGGAPGYNMPSNIVKVGTFYYALINARPYKTQKPGACLIRTSDVFDARSWRAWDGSEFNAKFADPYRDTIAKPQEHVCQPVFAGTAESLVQLPRRATFIATDYSAKGLDGPPGFYIRASRDLMHWSKPSLLTKVSDLQASDGAGKWTYDYVSLIEPGSSDRNFSTVTDTPYLYYVRIDGNHPSSRALFRRQIKLEFAE
jgi:hypothetical protein